jgi:hypothetical protein
MLPLPRRRKGKQSRKRRGVDGRLVTASQFPDIASLIRATLAGRTAGTAMPIEHIHTYLVHPGKAVDGPSRIRGNSLSLDGKMFALLNDIYVNSDRDWSASKFSLIIPDSSPPGLTRWSMLQSNEKSEQAVSQHGLPGQARQ